MVINVFINNKQLITVQENDVKYDDLCTRITAATHLQTTEFYLTSNGKLLSDDHDAICNGSNVHCQLRQLGGKGGFGSMLRAIGAQIEKTTNREACRDLSGRRLRDINEEKRVRAWLEKSGEREREAEERKKRKIEKLLAVPKHEFKDEEYEESRAKLTEKVNDALEVGLKQAEEAAAAEDPKSAASSSSSSSAAHATTIGVKRKVDDKAKSNKNNNKKRKGALWIDDDLSGSDLDSDDSEDEAVEKRAVKC